MLTPNPNECNSTLTIGTNNTYPCPYIDVNDRGHRFRLEASDRGHGLGFIQPLRRLCFEVLWSRPIWISNRKKNLSSETIQHGPDFVIKPLKI